MDSLSKKYMCPVCGYAELDDPPREPTGGGSYEICPSCGFQFGVSDSDRGYTYSTWRSDWISRGMPWSSVGIVRPQMWNPQAQLENLPVGE
jgi:hypothetical protein